MNKEILKRNIEQVINQPCNANYPKRIKENGLSEDGTHIMVKVTCDDSSWQCNLVDRDGNPIDYVERILEMLPEKYRDHLVTLKHTNWVYYSYEPVFDTDTQAMWDKGLSDFYDAKQGEQEKDILEDAILDGNEDGLIAETIRYKKQGEQNHADKVEPKFRNGQWLVWQNKCYKANYNGCGYELVDQDGLSTSLEYGTVDDNAHLWDITKDAKDGDVLCTYECGEPKIVFFLKGTPKKHYALSYHCYYNIMYPHFASDSEKGCLAPNDEDVKPATKEQREQLEKAMADAGYTFDFAKKELKKIEQKTAAWSEEDETTIDNLVWAISNDCIRPQDREDYCDWLKSLKDRVQPMQEWSEEDEQYLLVCKNALAKYQTTDKWDAIIISQWLENKLKSLRPQARWKPTEEQMKALHDLNLTGNISYAGQGQELINLYNDLKKLTK